MEQWKAVLVQVFGGRSRKKWKTVAFDIMSVDTGIKQAYLFDQWSCSKEEARSLLVNLQKQQLIHNKLGILTVDWNLLIFSVQSYQFPKLRVKSIIVDISVSLKQPLILDKVTGHYLATDEAFQDFCRFVNRENEEECLNSVSIPEFEINVTDMINPPCLYGLALGYPFIYWFNREKGDDSCLDMQPLRVYQVKGRQRNNIDCHIKGHSCYCYKNNSKPLLRTGEVNDMVRLETDQFQETKHSFPTLDVLEQKEDTLSILSKMNQDPHFRCQSHAEHQMNASCENEGNCQSAMEAKACHAGHDIFSFTLPECCNTQTARDHAESWFSIWRSSVPWCSLFSDVWMEEKPMEPQAICL